MSYNGLGNPGALGFADALKVNSTLLDLDIRYKLVYSTMMLLHSSLISITAITESQQKELLS
jgi:hypothetical protein